jgi:DNA-binding NarL/FixJ family response regulator
VLVAVRHPSMRRLTRQLLDREHRCWTARELGPTEPLDAGLSRVAPDLLVVDSGDFPACCAGQLGAFPPGRVIVIGPEPLAAYRHAALAGSAGAWLPREAIGDELSVAMRRILGCSHAPCPTAHAPQEDTVSRSDKV